MSSGIKKATSLVGLTANPEARSVLVGLYRETLEAVQAIPAEAKYRQDVESTTNFRLSLVESEKDTSAIESALGLQDIEEAISHAENELALIPKMVEWKAWEEPL